MGGVAGGVGCGISGEEGVLLSATVVEKGWDGFEEADEG